MQPDPGAPAPLRVVVVDADDRVRESLTRLLCIGDRIEVVGSAGGAEPALDLVRATDPDIVVIDPRLPEVDEGVDLHPRRASDLAALARPAPERLGRDVCARRRPSSPTASCARPSARPTSLSAILGPPALA